MEKHITLVGILNIVYDSLALIGSIILFAVAIGFRFLISFVTRVSHTDLQDIAPEVLSIVPIVLVTIGVLILIFSLIGIIGAIGVIKRKEWGRITMLVISFFNLVHIPLGTILGIYSIWVLLNDETIRICNPTHTLSTEK